jgi:hypothetical protein
MARLELFVADRPVSGDIIGKTKLAVGCYVLGKVQYSCTKNRFEPRRVPPLPPRRHGSAEARHLLARGLPRLETGNSQIGRHENENKAVEAATGSK